jgi:hypothetical protein
MEHSVFAEQRNDTSKCENNAEQERRQRAKDGVRRPRMWIVSPPHDPLLRSFLLVLAAGCC